MGDVLILCYHAVSETWPAQISVTPAALPATDGHGGVARVPGRHLLGGGLCALPPGVAWPSPSTTPTARSSRHRQARSSTGIGLPGHRLRAHRVRRQRCADGAGRAIESGSPGRTRTSWCRCPGTSCGELGRAGWEIGSHTRTHPRLPELDDAGAGRRARAARATSASERLGRQCRSIAYPYGDHDARVAAAAREAGYLAGCGVRPLDDPQSPLQRARVGVYNGDDARRFRLKTSPAMRRLRASPAWRLVRPWSR